MRRLSTTTIGMMAWSKRVCVLLVVVSLLFDLSVCLCRPECLSVTGLRFTKTLYDLNCQVNKTTGHMMRVLSPLLLPSRERDGDLRPGIRRSVGRGSPAMNAFSRRM